MGRPTLILVTGPPGSGKSTLAHAVAEALGCPAVSRDEIKVGMALAEPAFVPAHSDPLTMRTFGAFFAVLDVLLRAEVTTVAEAAFQDQRWRLGLDSICPRVDVRVLRCRVDPAVATDRVRARLRTDPHRSAHADGAHLAAPVAPFAWLSLDVPSLDVDTTAGFDPPLRSIADFALAPARPSTAPGAD